MNVSSEDVRVSELMERIRAELAGRDKTPGSREAGASIPVPPPATVSLPDLPKPRFQARERYALNDFLALHDRDFIDAAYQGLLKRHADPTGTAHFLEGLRNGQVGKIEILGRLRYSPEGRALRVSVKGLASAYTVQRMYRLPVIGSIMAFGSTMLRLPRIMHNLHALESYQHQRNAEFEALLGDFARTANANQRQLTETVAAHVAAGERARKLLGEHATRLANLGAQHARTQARIEAGQGRIGALEQRGEATDARIDAAATRMEATEGRLNEHGVVTAALDARVQRAEALGEDSAGRLQSVGAQLAAVDSHLATLERARLDLAARLDSAEAAGAATSEKLRILDIELRARVGSFEAELARVAATEPRLAAVEATTATFGQRLTEAHHAASQTAAGLRENHTVLEQRLVELQLAVQTEQGATQMIRQRLSERLARIEGRVHEQALTLASTQRTKPAAEPAAKKTPAKSAPAPSRFDALYFAFEDRFRGTREDIRKRVAYYLPLLRESVVGREGASVLDIGCGRGEWLELLRDEKFSARGIDINEGMLAACREFDLDVIAGDALAHLKRLPDNALGAVTGFHIIEHVSLDTLIELLEQACRVVQPGGLVIFETPNPENLLVGACDFYTDPTHQRPLPPTMTQFLMESAGFVDVEVHRVNANLLPKLFDEPAENDARALRSALAFLRSAFLCAPDYSIVGRVA